MIPESPVPTRSRRDLCPGVLRPWLADDGALVRVRLIGGLVSASELAGLSEVSRRYGDGDLHLTGRANLQLRAMPHADGLLPSDVVEAIAATGLLPSRTHELARNVMVSPQTGLVGGRADLRPVAAELDRLLCADPGLADLPGRFLFVLDDGRGDLSTREPDLGLVVVDAHSAQLRVGSTGWGEVVPLDRAAPALVALARRFLSVRDPGVTAPWHVDELAAPLTDDHPRDPRTNVRSDPLPFGPHHLRISDGVLAPDLVDALTAAGHDLVVTPWRGVLNTGAQR
ncbi:MAG: nitrite reductase [Nocardioides sp.]